MDKVDPMLDYIEIKYKIKTDDKEISQQRYAEDYEHENQHTKLSTLVAIKDRYLISDQAMHEIHM